jgi:hypothetical protein
MKPYDRTAAYHAVMNRIRETVNLPVNRGPQSWLAEQLKISRQVTYVWENNGIPEHHAEEIGELLDMDPIQVCPSLAVTYLPEPVFNAIVEASTKKKPFHVKLVELVKLGLKWEQEPARPAPKAKPEPPMKAVSGFVPISAEELSTQRQEALKAGADLSVKGRSK